MKPNSLDDRGFRRKAKAVNGRKTHRKTEMEKHFITVDRYQKPLVFWQGNLRPLSNGEQHAYKTQL